VGGSVIQYAITCPDEDNCTAIVCEDDSGAVVWVSHMDAAIPPEVRIAVGTEVEDHRG
jgi:hypothetical protein